MTESLFVPSTPDRLLWQHRTSHFVRSPSIRPTNGTKGHLSGSNPLAKLGDGRLKSLNWRIRDGQRHSQPRSFPIDNAQTPRLLP